MFRTMYNPGIHIPTKVDLLVFNNCFFSYHQFQVSPIEYVLTKVMDLPSDDDKLQISDRQMDRQTGERDK